MLLHSCTPEVLGWSIRVSFIDSSGNPGRCSMFIYATGNPAQDEAEVLRWTLDTSNYAKRFT
jgi:hypothetical protein